MVATKFHFLKEPLPVIVESSTSYRMHAITAALSITALNIMGCTFSLITLADGSMHV